MSLLSIIASVPLNMSIQKCTDTHKHTHTIAHMTKWLAADGEKTGEVKRIDKIGCRYLIAQQRCVECSANFEHLQIQCFFLLFHVPCSLWFLPVVSPSVLSSFASRIGSQSPEKKNTKKRRNKQIKKNKKQKKKK